MNPNVQAYKQGYIYDIPSDTSITELRPKLFSETKLFFQQLFKIFANFSSVHQLEARTYTLECPKLLTPMLRPKTPKQVHDKQPSGKISTTKYSYVFQRFFDDRRNIDVDSTLNQRRKCPLGRSNSVHRTMHSGLRAAGATQIHLPGRHHFVI